MYAIEGGLEKTADTRDPRLGEIEERERDDMECASPHDPAFASLTAEDRLLYVRARGYHAASYLAGVHAVAPSRRASVVRVWSLLRRRSTSALLLEDDALPLVARIRRGIKRAGDGAETFARGAFAYALDVGLRTRLQALANRYRDLGNVEQTWTDIPRENPTPREHVIDLLQHHAWVEVSEGAIAGALDSLYKYASAIPATDASEAKAGIGQLIALSGLECAYRDAYRAYMTAYARWRESRSEADLGKVKTLADKLYVAAERWERWVESKLTSES
jgi:hypothetical protein